MELTARPDSAPTRRRALVGASSLAVLFGLMLAPASAAQDDSGNEEDSNRITGFSIPNTRAAHALSARARSHIDARRWNEAIEDLQTLIESHRGELIIVEGVGSSTNPVHHGASGWAAEELLALPEEARNLYRARFGKRAQSALEQARASGNRQSVIELAHRWPATEEATLAWWTLGDIELELGNLVQAREAWMRALSRRLQQCIGGEFLLYGGHDPLEWRTVMAQLLASACPLLEGEQMRCDFALATLGEENPLAEAGQLSAATQGSLRLPGPGEGAHGTPGPDASTWPRPFKIPSPHPFEPGNSGNLFPVRVGDVVFLSNSMRLFAINAYSGNLRWASKMPPGWEDLSARRREEFFEGISPRDTMIAPAASERIVVSAHQVPVSDLENATFRNIAITTIIPDRRLYAYDIEPGTELWNHHPPETWDGESGSFTDRVSVAGPPVISASRVIVPVHRMYGRIEFYVACFDLVSGEVLWTTQLVSGQRELNMFARAEREFSAPPVRIEKDKVVVLTQLGAVAVLDLFSGSIIWETLYDQIVPPARSSFSAQRIKSYWRNSPPVVADGTIVVTPFDSRSLIGYDLESGETLWSLPYSHIDQLAGPYRDDVNLLIGADDNTVYLGGWPVMALRSSGGLGREAPMELAWRYPAGEIETDNSTSARAILLSDRIIIPTRSERIEVDRFGGGRRHKSVPWKSGRSGNMLVEDGTLYTLTTGHLDGYFEWDMLLERGQRAYEENNGDAESSLYLASLLSERSRTELEAGRTGLARDWLLQAEELLQPFLSAEQVDEAIAAEMHSLLRTRGKVFIDLADGASALKALRRARDWASNRSDLRDTLIEEYSFLYGTDEPGQLDILQTLEESCMSLSMSAMVTLDPELPYGWRFEPVITAPRESFAIWKLPISMWVSMERANIAADSGFTFDELSELHDLIEEWPEQPIPDLYVAEETLAEFATRRIGELIEVYGRAPYEPFELEAQGLLEEARTSIDRKLLMMVNELFPWSMAAREANDQLLIWATENGDVEAVAEIALSEIPALWSPELAGERELQLLLHMGAALEIAGNVEYAAALYTALHGEHPSLISTSPSHNKLGLDKLIERLSPPAAPSTAEDTPSFAPEFKGVLQAEGRHSFLGVIPPGSNETNYLEPVLLFARDRGQRRRIVSLEAYASETLEEIDPPRPLWTVRVHDDQLPPTWRNSVAFAPGMVIVASPDGVYAIDRDDGTRVWNDEWRASSGTVNSIQARDGLVVASVRTPGKMDMIHALDWTQGLDVWQTEIDPLRQSRDLILGSNRIVLMPRRSQRRGIVLDHFTGRRVTEFELPTRIHQSAHDATWIENGLLLVPWFLNGRNEERNHLVAIDLMDGQLAWDLNFGDVAGGRRELRSIVQYEGRTFLLLRPALDASKEGVRGIFVELHVGRRMGATARIGSFEQDHDQRLVGIHQERRVQLDSPFVYLYSFQGGEGNMNIMSLHLPFGNVRWTREIPITRNGLHNSLMQLPAESVESVALVISEKGEQRLVRPVSTLHVLDRRSGRMQSQLQLDSKLGTSADVHLTGLGQSLILAGEDMIQVIR